jgi:hypothetical protein
VSLFDRFLVTVALWGVYLLIAAICVPFVEMPFHLALHSIAFQISFIVIAMLVAPFVNKYVPARKPSGGYFGPLALFVVVVTMGLLLFWGLFKTVNP